MTSTVPTLPLNDKRAIPAIAFGTGTALFGRNVKAYITQALDGGFNHIDTAQAYGNEESVGDALREALGYKIDLGDEKVDIKRQVMGRLGREDIWVTTKYRGVGDAETALDASLEKLGLSYVDLYLIHAPSIVPDILATWSEFEQAQANGKVKSIGVPNFNIEQLQLILEHGKVVPAVNQVLFHPYNCHEQAELLEFSKAHGIRIESYGGLRPITKLPGGKLDGVLDGIAKQLGPKVTPAQVVMSWIRAKGVVIVTTTSHKERIREYLDVFALRKTRLTADDVAAIDKAGKHPPSVLHGQRHLVPKQPAAWLGVFVTVAIVVTLLRRFPSV
ncbi:Aldo/keto reductase [Ceratobasidium sp. AG-I]|nr:Aldo/keto reductase [Ceratobasidium sp. AG-I]